MDALDPWDRQKGEPERAYAYFARYRDMGRVRTVAKVATEVDKSREYLHKLATTHGWVRRAQAWDREQDRVWSEQLAIRRREMTDRHARLATAMQNKIVTRLQQIDASQLSTADVARWLEIATKLERLALGLPETATAVVGADGGPVEVEFASLDDAQREAYFARLMAEAKARAGLTEPDDEEEDGDVDEEAEAGQLAEG